jgi:tetratricopeptide (TPR) repeat protein
MLRKSGDLEQLTRFAATISSKEPELATELRLELVVHLKQLALIEVLFANGAGAALVQRAIEAGSVDVLVALLPSAAALDADEREQLYEAIAARAPTRRAPMLRELATLRTDAKRFTEAVETLAALAALEQSPQGRAALHIERGGLLLRQLEDRDAARLAFERALVEDANQLVAVRELVELYREGEPERFAAMVERLSQLAGPEAVMAWRSPLADAYETLGRTRDAYTLLGQLDETNERIARRVALARKLGLEGEAFALSEKIATTRADFEAVLEGYLKSELVPFAVRLGARLMDEAPLPPALLRTLAERLAPTTQGAALAVTAWLELLPGAVADALRNAGREHDAAMADGFGAALSSTSGSAPSAPTSVVRWSPSAHAAPAGAVAIGPDTMPRLSSVLEEALTGLGAIAVAPLLDVRGGVEAWLAGSKLVIGAGALSIFGQAELTALLAIALSLGEDGASLRGVGQPAGWNDAAVRAFAAYPASLAFLRVVAQLDDSVRGQDPARVDVGAVLRQSGAFRAVALAALDSLRAGA